MIVKTPTPSLYLYPLQPSHINLVIRFSDGDLNKTSSLDIHKLFE